MRLGSIGRVPARMRLLGLAPLGFETLCRRLFLRRLVIDTILCHGPGAVLFLKLSFVPFQELLFGLFAVNIFALDFPLCLFHFEGFDACLFLNCFMSVAL